MDNTPHWLTPVPLQETSPTQKPRTGHGQQIVQSPLHTQVVAAKNEIDRIAPAGQWDDAKKITNTYEYIFLSLQRRTNDSVSAKLPLSRSYFKMIEIWNQLGLGASLPARTAHSAEGPGGFLEAIQERTGGTLPMTAMTLRSTERTIPGWRKSAAFLNKHPTVNITYGADGTGNLYHLANQDYFTQAAGTVDLYTADGGFDFSADFNGQENTVQRLLVAEALAGLNTLRPQAASTMILKIFDTTHRATLELLWILSTVFERTALIKPHTSRPANSERYWIGVGYRGAPAWVITLLRELTATDAPTGWDAIFEGAPPWTDEWETRVTDFQGVLETVQLAKIQLTLNIIKSTSREQIRSLLVENIRNSRDWCQRNGVPINPSYLTLTDEMIANRNLEEALAPFQASVVRTSLQALSQRGQTPRASTSVLPPRPLAAPAWRSAIPPSVLGRSPSHTAGGAPPSPPSAPRPSPQESDHESDSL
jgi:hypothetical protein